MITAIKVTLSPTLFHSDDGRDWNCQHVSTTTDVIEHTDHYKEAVTGMPQTVYNEPILQCNDCPAWCNQFEGEWINE